jgi:cell division protein FtsB
MKIMRNFAKAVAHIWHLPFVKYGVITIIGVVLVGFVGENSLLAHLRHKYYISSLSDEISVYNERYQNDMRQIRELNRNPKAMERIARERYFMKQDDEDIFVLSDDERDIQTPSIESENETAE